MLRRGVYGGSRGGATAALLAACLGGASAGGGAGALQGCTSENTRAFSQGEDTRTVALGGGETEGDVRRLLGEPDRVLEAKDEATGRTRLIWVYERTTDVNGSKSVRRVQFRDGRALSDAESDSPRPAVTPDIPADRTTGRDKDW